MPEEKSAGSACLTSHSPAEDGKTEESSAINEPAYALLLPNENYDRELALNEREEKWGFTLAELQCATKVVSRLFRDPSLFVGDPYLADSRLYIMITRDRKTKREHREVYKTIMNEEKSRRKRYERMKDVETINRTGMKRERVEALNILTRPDVESDSSPLLLCEGQNFQDNLAQFPNPKGGALNDPVKLDDLSKEGHKQTDDKGLATTEIELLRLIGAFENLLRLEQVLRGEPIDHPSASPSFPQSTSAASPQSNDAVTLSRAELAARASHTPTDGNSVNPQSGKVPCANHDGFSSPSTRGDAPSVACVAPGSPAASKVNSQEVDWVAATQLTAQVYRYLPHAFGSQMPPALFPGPVPRSLCERERCSYISGFKLAIARQLLVREDLKKGGDRPDAADTVSSTRIEACNLAQFLHSAAECDVIVHDLSAPVRLDRVEFLRDLVASSNRGQPGCEETQWQASCSICGDAQWLLDAIELAMTEGSGDTMRQSTLESSSGLPFSTSKLFAKQTLNLFIARRLYCNENLLRFGSSPIVIERNAPISDSEEPDCWSIFDDVQQYACTRHDNLKLSRFRSCSTCRVRFNDLHPYYYSMCHLCGEFNYNKRLLARDLRGKVVLLTGCRIKIGYAMALSLLRCGAVVLGTTRFVHEAVARFQQEVDYETWKDRLYLFSLDLRDLWVVTQFCGFVRQRYPKLFAIINNAAQTIARTPQYTAHLRQIEADPSPDLRRVIEADRNSREWFSFFLAHSTVMVGQPLTIEHHPRSNPYLFLTASSEETAQGASLESSSPELREATGENSQNNLSLVAEQTVSSNVVSDRTLIFDRYDTQAEESDNRETNSWVMKLAEVQGSEAAEVMTINALSPFILNSKLKPCLTNREGDDEVSSVQPEPRFIINVSAMEGQFYRFKQTTHPHTNMAKAALNMMTRTSAEDYAKDGIYMNSVDTGWITDESPKIQRERRSDTFSLCPLDEVDAAARCLDLIYTNSTAYGTFFKDYREIPW
ncbi:unnamed protein product [Phytomonas sp. EM1]|nr:unnamed protein product [Phytomonas sp. EM1]|eukprot:CCW62375.1 unnamed protein product [Phytomonas sp. isolate EM1]